METEYYAVSSIHHSRPNPQSLDAYVRIVIPAGVFSPTSFGISETEIEAWHRRGWILTIPEHEAALEKRSAGAGGQLVINGRSTNIGRRRSQDEAIDAIAAAVLNPR